MWSRVTTALKGWKTVIFSVLLIIAGILSTIMMAITGDMVDYFLSPKYQVFAPLIVSLIGAIAFWLRYYTDTRIGHHGDGDGDSHV